MKKPIKALPKLRSEEQERIFWEAKDRDVPYLSLIKVWLQEKVEHR